MLQVVITLLLSLSVLAQNDNCKSDSIIFTSERTLHIDIYQMTLDDLKPSRITADLEEANYDATISPDATYIVFVSETNNGDVYKINLSTGENTQLTSTEARELYPSWSPDGSHIAYSSDIDGDFEIYLMDVDDPQNLIQLTDNNYSDIDASWSPDGSHIAYSSDIDGDFEIYLMDVDAPENLIQLTDNVIMDTGPAWSSGGDAIVYASGTSQHLNLFVEDVLTLETTEITSTPFIETQPAWSPDGNSIAFSSNQAGNYDVYVLDIESGQILQLTDDTHFDGYPVWQPTACDIQSYMPESTEQPDR